MTDDCTINGTTCVSNMGETWSRPVIGRIKVINDSGTTEDRYVAIFGGGFDPGFNPGTQVLAGDRSSGRAFYIVDVERGKIIFKATSGKDDTGRSVLFAPMPATPALADVDDDGYLDFAYIGDLNGRMWKIDLRPDSRSRRGRCSGCGSASETLTGYHPFLLYDGATRDGTTSSAHPIRPIFLEAGIIFISGGPSPTLGIAFGTGNRAELDQPDRRAIQNTSAHVPYVNRFYFVKDSGVRQTLHEEDLINVTPSDGIDPGSGPADAANTPNGYFLNFGSYDEKAVSTVFATQGILTLVTFSPGEGDPCARTGESFRYRFSFLTAQGAIRDVLSPPGGGGVMAQYREKLGPGMAGGTQSHSPNGDVLDGVIFWNGRINQQNTSFLKTNRESWKEQ
jgi:Tfp pilus tip-associated adhesin PilY1